MEKLKICYDKPLHVGFCIFYGYLKQKYGKDVILCYTDSLILEIFTDNEYNDIKEDIDLFDTSNYAADIHKIPKTVSVVEKMKDEFAGIPIDCFYGTGEKAYCMVSNFSKKLKVYRKILLKINYINPIIFK